MRCTTVTRKEPAAVTPPRTKANETAMELAGFVSMTARTRECANTSEGHGAVAYLMQ